MQTWTYISPAQRFQITLPSDWAEYDDEPNVSAFFDATRWSGNLRMTHLFMPEPTNDHAARTRQFIEGIVAEHNGSEQKTLGSLTCACYQEEITGEDDEDLILYFWLGAFEHHRFACSFTASRENIISSDRLHVLQVVENMIGSIEIFHGNEENV